MQYERKNSIYWSDEWDDIGVVDKTGATWKAQ